MDPIWERLHASRPWGKYPAEDLVRTLMRQFPDAEERKQTAVLEIGCGAGANLTFLLQEGFQVYGIDGAPSAIARAKAHVSTYIQNGQRCELQVSEFSQLDYADRYFDIVIDYLAMATNRTETSRSTVAEAKRVLKPGGYFYSRSFGTNTVGAGTGVMLEPGTSENSTMGPCKDMGTLHYFTEQELRALYTGWSHMLLRRVVTDITGVNDSVIEEWLVWVRK